MNSLKIIILTIVVFVTSPKASLKNNEYIQYIHPKADAKFVSCETDLIIKFYSKWDAYLNSDDVKLEVSGSLSGNHSGKILQTKDKVTYVFKPDTKFRNDEVVLVKIEYNISGKEELTVFSFFTSGNVSSSYGISSECKIKPEEADKISNPSLYGERSEINGVSVPSDFPVIDIDILEETAEGRLFLNNGSGTPYIIILENDGTPYYYQQLPGPAGDFKLQPTGTLTWAAWPSVLGFFEMDSNYKVIDTLACGNGYRTDTHDLQLLSNGNYLIIGLDEQIIDMSQYVEGGNPQATVIGNIVQEMDRLGNVLFEWRSWDHYNIIDAVNLDLTAASIDYAHINAIAVDYDGHLLVSARTLSEITKINRQTGNVIWRLGGENNQFNFVNDDYGISYQHDIRPVPGKENHYTLFDNGVYHPNRYSRAVEFSLDTTSMMAIKIWEYRHLPDRFQATRCSVQRLPNGNTLIDWSGGGLPIASEVTPEGDLVYELSFADNIRTYRSFRFEWDVIMSTPYLITESWSDKVSLIFNKFGDNDVTGYVVYCDTLPDPEIVADTVYSTNMDFFDLMNHKRYYFRVAALNSDGEESGYSNQEHVFVNYVPPGKNLILNGEFTADDSHWHLITQNGASATSIIEDFKYHVQIENSGTVFTDVQIIQENVALKQGNRYLFEFDSYASENRIIEAKILKSRYPYDNYSKTGYVAITKDNQRYSFEFEMEHISDFDAKIVFNAGDNQNDISIDNVSLKDIGPANIKFNEIPIPENFQLLDNYPNPFNPRTTIKYELPDVYEVELNIYNILGQKVATLVSKRQVAGRYQVEWDASDFASGIYYYRLITNSEFAQTKKMILMK